MGSFFFSLSCSRSVPPGWAVRHALPFLLGRAKWDGRRESNEDRKEERDEERGGMDQNGISFVVSFSFRGGGQIKETNRASERGRCPRIESL